MTTLNPDESITLPLKKYTYIQDLSEGSFGYVQLWLEQGSKMLVVSKKLSLAKSKKFMESEILAGRTLKHKNIVEFLHNVSNEDEDCAYLFFKYVNGSTLFDLLEKREFVPWEENFTKSLFKQAINALSYIHANGFAHLDLKPENIMVSGKGNLTIIDFGLCRFEMIKLFNGKPNGWKDTSFMLGRFCGLYSSRNPQTSAIQWISSRCVLAWSDTLYITHWPTSAQHCPGLISTKM